MHPLDAADYLDTSPEIEFSVWASCGDKQPDAWQKGFAAVVLDDGVQRGAGKPHVVSDFLSCLEKSTYT